MAQPDSYYLPTIICSMLAKSMVRDESVRKPAEAALLQFERMPGFCSCLADVITMKGLASHVDIRLMASVYLKNSINRHWRQRRDSPVICSKEKLHLRRKLVLHLREENYQIAQMLAVLISKIAHFDYPAEWPELFSFLAKQLQSADDLTSHRIFMILCRTLKELSTKHPPDRSNFAEGLRPVKDVSPVLLAAAQSLLPYNTSFRNGHPKFWDFIGRACTKVMKILDAIQQRHPYSFVDKSVLQPVLSFCLNKITDPEPDILSFEQFLIKCMVMIKSILECKQYKPSLTGSTIDENRVAGVFTSLVPEEQIVLLCNVLIRRHFVLTENDLEKWNENPEVFHHEQDLVQGTEKLRPCAESLFIVLFENHIQLLAPIVVSILQEAMNGCPTFVTEISPRLLLKEAAYGAAAHVYNELSNYLSFKDWFNGALSLELSNDHPNMCIIHRKVALILEWVSEIKDDNKRVVYCALMQLLQRRDLSVRLAACRTLCLHVEDADFSERDFSDLLPVCWASCFMLVDEVQEFDSKVWEESSGESLLQIQLLMTLRNFVNALGYHSPSSYGIFLPILQQGIDINGPDGLNLLEDSMLLWETTVSHAPAMVPQLLAYFPCLVEILEATFDQLEVAVKITEGYIVLGGREFLNMHASRIAILLNYIVGNANDRRLLSTLTVIDILIQCFPMEVPPLISSTLQKLVVICLSGREDGDPSNTAIKASSAAILARILVMNNNYLAHLTSQPSLSSLLRRTGVSVEYHILLSLVDIWLDKVDNVSSSSKKIFGRALAMILTLRLPQVLDKLDRILSVCSGILLGGTDDITNEESSGDDMSSSRSHGESSLSSKELRRRQIKEADPISRLSLENTLRCNFQICGAYHGESFNSAIARMKPAAIAQLKQALKTP
ncbi:hypothetical protein V6N12_017325 [Hibiscus sabdariffa]|uniref:Importin N-terminal domain-containing protein n=1 Tax=Hibiscus sabdariffa TaxID=183260 RepID=A0ABR2CF58_9ROSI